MPSRRSPPRTGTARRRTSTFRARLLTAWPTARTTSHTTCSRTVVRSMLYLAARRAAGVRLRVICRRRSRRAVSRDDPCCIYNPHCIVIGLLGFSRHSKSVRFSRMFAMVSAVVRLAVGVTCRSLLPRWPSSRGVPLSVCLLGLVRLPPTAHLAGLRRPFPTSCSRALVRVSRPPLLLTT